MLHSELKLNFSLVVLEIFPIKTEQTCYFQCYCVLHFELKLNSSLVVSETVFSIKTW
jgi:hypothetical protein